MSAYRGFVELPQAVIDAGRQVWAAFEAAIADRAKPPEPRHHRLLVDPCSSFAVEAVMTVLAPRDFTKVACTRLAGRRKFELSARHRCGAWCVRRVDEMDLIRAIEPWLPIHDAIDSMGCYCVRREVES